MFNWSLLLALFAIFQPITSFTERNIVDGRQACCGGQTDSLLRDSLPGTHRHAKETSVFRRVTDQDDIREGRLYELRQRDTTLSRESPDSTHPANGDESDRRNPITARSDRVEYRSQNIPNYVHRDHRLGVQRWVRDARNIRSLESENQTYRNLNRNIRNSLSRFDDRSRLSSRDDNRIRINYQVQRNLESRRERMQFVSGNLRRLTPNRDMRDNIRHLRADIIDDSNDNRRDSRFRIIAVRRESPIQNNIRSSIAGERRDQRLEQRRSLSDNVVIERSYTIRKNSRAERNANNDRSSSSQRLTSERIEDNRKLREDIKHIRKQTKINTERKLSGEKIQLVLREIRDSRQDIYRINLPTRRLIESRRDVRYDEKLSSNFRDENRLDLGRSRRTNPLKRDVRMDRRVVFLENNRIHNMRDETIPKLLRSSELMQRRDESHRQIEYRSKMENRERDTYERHLRNEIQARHRELEFNKVESESGTGTTNWQYMLYTVQAAYLCGLLIQMLTPKYGKKSSLIDACWWPLSSQDRIKVD